jgi:hypothetical protein
MNLPQNQSDPPLWRLALRYAACYLAWLLLSVLGFGLMLALRTNLFDLATLWKFNPWQVRTIDRFAIFLLGLGWFVGILVLENYLRQGVEQAQLGSRLMRVSGTLLLVAALSYGAQQLASL